MALGPLVDSYFRPEYYDLLQTLANADTYDATLRDVKDTVEELSLQLSAAKSLLTELQGEFTGELYGSVASLIDEIDAAYYLINNNLTPTIASVDNLSKGLPTLRHRDDEYQVEKEDYSVTNSDPFSRMNAAQIDSLSPEEKERYRQWKENLNEIENTLLGLIPLCEKMQGNCDDNIDLIDEFNNAVIDLRLKLVALVVAQGDMAIEDVQKMTLKEKEAYLQDLLDRLRAGYEAAKLAYHAALDDLQDSEDFKTTCQFLCLLFPRGTEDGDFVRKLITGVDAGDTSMWTGWGEKSYIASGQFLVEFVEWYTTKKFYPEGFDPEFDDDSEGRTLQEMMTDYINGASLEDSGLLYLYKTNAIASKGTTYYYGCTDADFEKALISDVTDYFGIAKSMDELKEVLGVGLEEIQQASNDFNKNYTDYVAKGLMYKSVNSLKNELQYDEIRQNDPKYKEYVFNEKAYLSQVNTPAYMGWTDYKGDTQYGYTDDQTRVVYFMQDPNISLTDNEKKMLGYLWTTGQYDKAANYVNIIENGVNRRAGEITAERTYNKWLEGSNEDLDYLWDNARAFIKGVGDGGYDYFDSFVDLIDPDVVPTAHDYEIMRMQELVSQPVYKLGKTYYSCDQMNSFMADYGYVPIGPTPSQGYINSRGDKTSPDYEEIVHFPEETLWDESIKTSYGVGYEIVEKSVKAVSKVIHPALGATVEAAYNFGKARETAAQAAFMENADLSSSTLNDGVDYSEFWAQQAPELAKAGLGVVGEFSENAKRLETLVESTEAIISVPGKVDGIVDTFKHDANAPWYELIYDGYRAYDKFAGVAKKASGGQITISTASLVGKGTSALWGKDSDASKAIDKLYNQFNKYGTQYMDAFSK